MRGGPRWRQRPYGGGPSAPGPVPRGRRYKWSMRNPTTARRLPAPLIPALLVPALVLTACSSGTTATSGPAPSGSSATRTRPSTTPPKAPAPRTPVPKTSPPRASASPALKAADGTDVKACRDASCEIVVHRTADIPLSGFGFSSFVFTHVAADRLTFAVVRPASSDVNGYFSGPGYIGFSNGVKATVERLDASGFVLRLQPKTVDPNDDELVTTRGGGIYG